MNSPLPCVRLKPGRERSLLRRHPWIFSGAIAAIDADAAGQPPAPGAAVRIADAKGEELGTGFYSPASQIRVRVLRFGPDAASPDADWLRATVTAAAARRAALPWPPDRNAMRIVHGESDGLPGLVIDRYADVLSVQILSAGFEALRDELPGILFDLFPEVTGIYERSDAPAREREGLAPRTGELARRPGAPAPRYDNIEIQLGDGLRSVINIAEGQKTGSYLDQTENHARVGRLAAGRDVLDAFCYDGGFSLACLRNGARRVTAVDASEAALQSLRTNLALNGFPAGAPVECRRADVFRQLRAERDARHSYDLIILDPPKFAESKAHVQRACRAYKDINLLAFKLLRPGGLLATFSCSGAIPPELFRTVVAEAACDANRDAHIAAEFSQPADHPVALAFPEGLYLKGLLLSV